MHRQPDRQLIMRRPFDAVHGVRRNVDAVATLQLDGLVHAVEAKPRRALQHHDPLMLLLVIPEAVGRGVPVGHDSLDADRGCLQQRRDQLAGQVRREISKYVGGSHFVMLLLVAPPAGPADGRLATL